MYSADQITSLYEFLLHTGEGNLRKMLCDKSMSDGHLRFLLKIVKMSPKDAFINHLEQGTFPVMKFNALEMSMKEKFWNTCCVTFESRGLLNKAKAAA